MSLRPIPFLSPLAQHDVGAELVDRLANDAAALQYLDGGFHFILAVGLLKSQRLAGARGGVEADALAAETEKDSRFTAVGARSKQEH